MGTEAFKLQKAP